MGVIPDELVQQFRTVALEHLAPIAVDSFIEYSIAGGERRDRLRTSWHALRDLIGHHRAVVGTAQVTFDAHVVRIPGAGLPIAIDSSWQLLPDRYLDAPVVDLAQRLGLVEDHAFSAASYFFAKGDVTFGVICERAPQLASVRRLVVAKLPSLCDVVVVDAIEGLLVHLERVFM